MALDLKTLKPTVVSKDLKGKYVFIYGPPKIGKTTLAVQFPKSLLLAFEHGYNNIHKLNVVDIPTWAELKAYVKQLKDPEIKSQFDTIVIDTVGQAYDRCNSYICDRENVEKIGDIPYGAGYGMVDKEVDETFRKIQSYGYAIVFIGHSKEKTDSDGTQSVTHIVPDLPERCSKIINRMVDLTAYLGVEDKKRFIYPRQTTIDKGLAKVDIYAGSHFGSLNNKIELNYESLVKAIGDAMEQDAKAQGVKLSDKPIEVPIEPPKLDYKKIRSEIGTIAKALNALDEQLDEPHYMDDYKAIVANILGKDKLVRDCTESQVEQLELIRSDLQDYLKQNNL